MIHQQPGFGATSIELESIDELTSDNTPLNSHKCENWIFVDELNLKKIQVHWPSVGVNKKRLITLKELIRASFGVGEQTSGLIYGREKTIKNKIAGYKALLNALDVVFGRDKRLDQLTLEQIRKLVIFMATKDDGDLWAFGTVDNIITNIRQSAEHYKYGFVADGISCDLPTRFFMMTMLQDHVASLGIDYHKWAESGTWDNLPVDIALLILNDMISLVESPTAKFLVEYFDFQRTTNRVSPSLIYNPQSPNRKENKGFTQNFVLISHKVKNGELSSNYLCDGFDEKSKLIKLAEIFIKHGYLSNNEDESKIFESNIFFKYAGQIKSAAFFVFTALTGIRISEAASIRYSRFSNHNDVIFFESSIYKTNKGLPRTRSLSKEAYDVMCVAARISYLPLESDVLPFSATHLVGVFTHQTINSRHTPNKESLGKSLTATYVNWISVNKNSLPEHPKSASPHALRHIFSAIALRLFSGDVRNNIRRHFGHSYGSNFTKAYVTGKLDDAILSATESEFFRNFIDSISADDTEFYSAVAKRIRERVEEDHSFYTVDELADVLTAETIEACELLGHEFGYSVPWASDLDDSEITDVHHLKGSKYPEDVVRIGVTHQHLIDSYPNTAVSEASKQVLNMCEQMLDQLNIDISELNYD